MSRVLVASDKFKGSLTASEVAVAVGAGVRRVRPDAEICSLPVADGGDGTLAAFLAAGFTEVPPTATGPTGGQVSTRYARQGDLAVVEMADVSGLARLPGSPDPLRATSRGTGEVLAAAVDAGCRRVVLGIGGSASTDGGRAWSTRWVSGSAALTGTISAPAAPHSPVSPRPARPPTSPGPRKPGPHAMLDS